MPNHYKTLNEIPPNLQKEKIQRPRSHHHIWATHHSPTTSQRFSLLSTHALAKKNYKIKRQRKVGFKEIALSVCINENSQTLRGNFSDTLKKTKNNIYNKKKIEKSSQYIFFYFLFQVFHFPAFFSNFFRFSFCFSHPFESASHALFIIIIVSFLVLFSVWLLRKQKGKIQNIIKKNQNGFSSGFNFLLFSY